jgi:hypothetical protein
MRGEQVPKDCALRADLLPERPRGITQDGWVLFSFFIGPGECRDGKEDEDKEISKVKEMPRVTAGDCLFF